MLKELSRRGNDVRCLSATSNPQWARLSFEAIDPLGVDLSLYPVMGESNWATQKWRTLRRPLSYTITRALEADLAKEIRQGYDVLHLEQLWAGYLADSRPRTLVSVSHLSSIDLSASRMRNPRDLFQRYYLGRSERSLLQRLKKIATLSPRLASSIQSVNRLADIFVIPFALDASLYSYGECDIATEPIIGFVGSMNWTPSLETARRLITAIFPLVKRRIPQAKLLIAGWHARKALSEFVEYPDVSIVQDVANPERYFKSLQVLAYPIARGTGIKVKLLEAMAWGVPIVTTTEGIEGMNPINGEHCLIADSDDAFAERVAELLTDVEARARLRRRARQFVEQEHSPVLAVDNLELAYRAIS